MGVQPKMNNPKKIKQEIKDYIKIRTLFLVIQLIGKDLLYFLCLEFMSNVVGFLPLSHNIYLTLLYILSFIVMEYLMQKSVFNYAYRNCGDKLHKYWWVDIIKIAAIPLILYYVIIVILIIILVLIANDPLENHLDLVVLAVALALWNGIHIIICNFTIKRAFNKRIKDRLELLKGDGE